MMIRKILLLSRSSSSSWGQIVTQMSVSNMTKPTMSATAAANIDSSPRFFLEERKDKRYVILKLNKPPINSLNSKFLTELSGQIEKIEESRDINGVILASNLDNVLSAGVDINELYPYDPERCARFWRAMQECWIKLYGSSKVYIAAINGHAIGAGCLLPMSCDYRIMSTGPYKIGANETLLGLQAAFWLQDVMLRLVGNRETERAIQLGLLFTPEQALKVKLIDEICEPEDLLSKAEQHMKMWLKIPTVARELTKTSMRRETLSKLLVKREADIEAFVEFVGRGYIQSALRIYFDELKNRKRMRS